MTGDARPLNVQQQRFVEEYVLDLNGSAAYRRAYPRVTSDAVARAAASRLLTQVNVAAAVRAALAARSQRTELTAAEVLGGLRLEAGRLGEGSSHGARV